MVNVKLVIEKHTDGFVAYPLGLKGIIVGEGDTFEEAWHDVQSAIQFHQDTFGPLETTNDPVEVFIAEAVVA